MLFKITRIVFDTDGNAPTAKNLARKYTGKSFIAHSVRDARERGSNIVSDVSGWLVKELSFERVKE